MPAPAAINLFLGIASVCTVVLTGAIAIASVLLGLAAFRTLRIMQRLERELDHAAELGRQGRDAARFTLKWLQYFGSELIRSPD